MSKKAKQETRQLRAIGHKLKPVVTVSDKGLTDSVLAEIERALNDHELIKIKLLAGSRADRDELAKTICASCKAQLVQGIGNVILVLRRTAQPDPRLSNLIRPL